MDQRLWENEQREIATYYPEAWPLPTKSTPAGWRLIMDPIPDPCDQLVVFQDLNRDAEISIGKRGKIRRVASSLDLASDSITPGGLRLLIPRRPYLVELALPYEFEGAAGPIHPKARVRRPEISLVRYPKHPHLSFDGAGDAWACPLSPNDTTWNWGEGATWDYLAQVAIWILKTEVWARTGGGIGDGGVWLGAAMPHELTYVLRNVGPDDPCRCGRGLRYLDCHLLPDIASQGDILTPLRYQHLAHRRLEH